MDESSKEKIKDVSNWLEHQRELLPTIDLTVVIPAYNEQWRLPTTLVSIIDFLDNAKYSYEIIVVDDGSKDETVSIVKKFEKIRSQVRLLTLPKNRGKGEAVRTGALNARGDRVLFCDADGSTPIEELKKLQEALQDGVDLAFGSRAVISESTKVKALLHRKLIGRTFNLLVNSLLIPGVKDTQCGFKMFKADAAKFLFKRQVLSGFAFDVEILALAHKSGMTIREIPVNWQNVAGSKVNLVMDSAKMLLEVLYLWGKFVLNSESITYLKNKSEHPL